MNTSEIWKPVVGFEGFYKVSSHGRVLSLSREVLLRPQFGTPGKDYTRRTPEKVLAARPANTGYPMVTLCRHGICKQVCVHALVAGAFIGHRPSKNHCVNHIDANRANNLVENLEWVTFAGNTQHAIKLGTFVPTVTAQFRDSRKRAVIGTHTESSEVLRFESLQAAVDKFLPGKQANALYYYVSRGKSRFGYTWSYE